MPRYIVQRSFDEGFRLGAGGDEDQECRAVALHNARAEATWLHSYVSADGDGTLCIYQGPSPESIRRAAALNHLPVDEITEIRVLDPYFYAGA
jgi:hypothetical protein